MKIPLTLLVLVGAAIITGGAAYGAAPSRYPLDLDTAVAKAYGTRVSSIDRSCTVWLNGRDEYALASMTLRGGSRDVGGLQFINTAGWFDMWRFHKPTAGVPADARASVMRIVHQVAARCGLPWTP